MSFTWITDNVIENRLHQLPASATTIDTRIRYRFPATLHVSSVNDDSSPVGTNFDVYTDGSAIRVFTTYKR